MPTERGLLNHTAGKGDKERSSKWRENYQDINWGDEPRGFIPDGAKQVKMYRESPEGTYATVVCSQHGSVRLTFDAWMAQVVNDRACFLCPLCGEPALSATPDFESQGN